MSTSRRPSILVALTICAGLCGVASAQSPCNLPDQVIGSRALSEADRSAIRECVNANRAGLSGEYDAIRRARQALLQPLRSSTISIPFRDAYSVELIPALTPLTKSDRDDVAINAIRIAGELGTDAGARLCVASLSDKRPGVRMMAAAGLARTFNVLQSDASMTAQQITRVLGDLASTVRKESDPLVLDGLAMTYEAAFGLPVTPSEWEVARARALADAAVEFGKRARDGKLGPDAAPALLRVSLALIGPVTQAPPNTNALREITGLGGDLLAHVLRRITARNVSETERAQLAVLVGQSENLLNLAGGAMNGTYTPKNLAELVATGKDTDFARRVLVVIGSEGELTKPPFSHPRDRFVP